MRVSRHSPRIVLSLLLILLSGPVPAEDLPPLTLELGQRSTRIVSVMNESETDWNIERAMSSCDCMTIDDHPVWVPAGISAELVVTVTGKTVGSTLYHIYLHGQFGDTVSRTVDLPINVVPARGGGSSGLFPLQLAARAREHDLYLSAEQVLALETDPVLVDTRSVEAFRRTSIPTAHRRDAQALRRRPADPARPVVLLDQGWGAPAAERACRRLRDTGSGAVHVLRGGLAAWIAAGGEIQGTVLNADPLIGITAEAFLPLAGYNDWCLLVYAGEETTAAMSLSDDQVVFIAQTAAEEATHRAVTERVSSGETPLRFLVVDPDPIRALARTRLVQAAGADAVSYISDGVDQLTNEILFHQQTRLASRQTVTTITHGDQSNVTPGGCSGCP